MIAKKGMSNDIATQLCMELYGLSTEEAKEEVELIARAAGGGDASSSGSIVSQQSTIAEGDEDDDDEDDDDGGGAADGAAGLLSDAAYRWMFGSVLCLHLAQQLCGINAVFFYSTSFFVGVIDNPDLGTAMVGAVNVAATIAASAVMDSTPRASLLALSAGGMLAFTVVITAALLKLIAPVAALGGVMGFVFLFAVGLGPIPWLIVSEMFPTELVTNAQAVASQLNWACAFVVGLGFPAVNAALGAYAFAPFGVVLLLALGFVLTVMPETYERTPAELHGLTLLRASDPAAYASKLVEEARAKKASAPKARWARAVRVVKATNRFRYAEEWWGLGADGDVAQYGAVSQKETSIA